MPNLPTSLDTLVDLLRWRADYQPDQLAYQFLVDGEQATERITYTEIDRQARAIGLWLQAMGKSGERILLLYPPGLAYIAAFFGCLYAGAVAVPVYPPRRHRPTPRLQAIAANTQASLALTTADILEGLQSHLAQMPELATLEWATIPEPAGHPEIGWQRPGITADSLTFLQYTSGSTAQPKGVMLSHQNVLHNLAHIYRCFRHTPESHGVIWLPPYHDMGLIGGILQPLFGGFPVTLMSPMAFLQQPFRWLQAISRYQATTSGGPSFAYDLCVRKITPEQRELLDLRSWNVAFNGAEPIRWQTLEAFTAAFAPHGFCPTAMYPCYGLAEATLLVSGSQSAVTPVVKSIKRDMLEQHRAVDADDQIAASTVVGCGPGLDDQRVVIVRPEELIAAGPGEVGEVWVAGPSVAHGYWNQPDETASTFLAYLRDTGEGPFLRTGDLGFLQDGELFVTGRIKDIIIIRGRNYYPQDIEQVVEQSYPGLRLGCGAAFSVAGDREEQLVIVQEVDRRFRESDIEPAIAAIRQAVAEQYDIYTHTVVLVKIGSVPKTSSGKIQRRLCRAQLLADQLAVFGRSTPEEAAPVASADEVDLSSLRALPRAEQRQLLAHYLCMHVAGRAQLPADRVDLGQPLNQFGLDSLAAIELQYDLETRLDLSLPAGGVLHSSSIAQLIEEVLALLDGQTMPAWPAPAPARTAPELYPPSHGQRALWFLHQLAPESGAYNIASALRISADLDLIRLERVLQRLALRHAALRATFEVIDGAPMQHIQPSSAITVQQVDVSGWDGTALNQHMSEGARRPFDLVQGPLVRVLVFSRLKHEHILLFVVHHIAADFWSLGLLLPQLTALYQADRQNPDISPKPPALGYADFVVWQNELLAGTEGERLWRYWQQQLAGPLPVLNLPTDRPHPPVQTYVGAAQSAILGPELTIALKELSRAHSTTLYTMLVSAFFVLLHRSTDQDDLLIGSPTSGRGSAALADVVGYFVNPVVLRANLAGNPTFLELLERVRGTIEGALQHQAYPFALLAERLQPKRDPSRSPLFQAMFSLQKIPGPPELAALAINIGGMPLNLPGLPAESFAWEQRTAQFDVQLVVAEFDQTLGATIQYNADLFDDHTARHMLGHFETLLHGIVAGPHRRIGNLPLLTAGEREALRAWNATAIDYSRAACVHALFEAQADRAPAAAAVIFDGVQITYTELNERANQLAHYLRGLGVRPGVIVGLCIERSPALMVGLLGILKAGAAYLPLDPAYPAERRHFMLEDARVAAVVTQSKLALQFSDIPVVVCLDRDQPGLAHQPRNNPTSGVTGGDSAYVIYTSGSTGRPKGVVVTHGNVVNFFAGMDRRIGISADDTLLAVTSISFDISVLELFWTLARGARVVLLSEQAVQTASSQVSTPAGSRGIDISLFYFASDEASAGDDRYRLLLEGARFADRHGFAAVWTPERHFHAFGGLYPNPSVISAALAAITERVRIRAGSVVLPLHNPIRVAEEWSVVDNLSRGRVGIAFASGWHADDFALYPANYEDRKIAMDRDLAIVQQFWRGEVVTVRGGAGNEIAVQLFPKPVQPELPIWITAAGNPETFIKAGRMGFGVLTHLLGQNLDEVAEKIRLYHAALAEYGHPPERGHVTLMLHTFLGDDREAVREVVRRPFMNYLRSSVGLIENMIRSLNLPLDVGRMSQRDLDDLLAFAFDRYFETGSLMGTPATCRPLVERLKAIGVDEIACLIDFGVDPDMVLESLSHLATLQREANDQAHDRDTSLVGQARRYNATMLQCTPSFMQLLSLNPCIDDLRSLRVLLLGGEALPLGLAQRVKRDFAARLINMYGPTETTVWSATYEVPEHPERMLIGRPIANTELYVLDRYLEPVPVGVVGELYIGGAGVTNGYLNRPELTAERFIPNPFAMTTDDQEPPRGYPTKNQEPETDNPNLFTRSPAHPLTRSPTQDGGQWSPALSEVEGVVGGRLYRTGDLARYLPDGTVDFLGRADYQVKLRGFRIELGEIETTLRQHPLIREAVVAYVASAGDQQLVAYVVPADRDGLEPAHVRDFVRRRLPEYMVPNVVVPLSALPLTANGKVDRKALPAPQSLRLGQVQTYEAPRSTTEQALARIWQQALQIEQVGIHDNFFDLGGHSLLMAQVHNQLQTVLQREIPLIRLLEYPTIHTLARYLSQHQVEQSFEQTDARAQKQRSSMMRQRQRAKID